MAVFNRPLHRSRPEFFWGDIAACDHLLQVYESDRDFLAALSRFVSAGFRKNESVVVIATPRHRADLDRHLQGFDLEALRAQDQYISLDAEEMLSEFMIDGWPDAMRFEQCIKEILRKASRGGREVRAFGEMVVSLWDRGQHHATIQLEYLWHQLQRKHAFSLFCAYPKSALAERSITVEKIYHAHSRVVPPAAVQ